MPGGKLRTRYASGALFQQTFQNGRLHVAGFGRYYNGEKEPDWTFRNLGDPGSPAARHLPAIASEIGVQSVLAPSPVAFNGTIIDAEELTTRVELGNGLVIFRNSDKPADGVLLAPGQAYAMSGAGCAVLWGYMINPHTKDIIRVGAAHMGLKSLLNNVAENLFTALGDSPPDMYFGVELSIDPEIFIHEWDHPTDAERNRQLCEDVVAKFGSDAVVGLGTPEERMGRIDLFNIARAHLMRLAVPSQNISCGMRIGKNSVFYTTRESTKRNLAFFSYH